MKTNSLCMPQLELPPSRAKQAWVSPPKPLSWKQRLYRQFSCLHVSPSPRPCFIEKLPQNLLYRVLKLCDERDLPALSLTCKTFRDIIYDEKFSSMRTDRNPLYAAFNINPYSLQGREKLKKTPQEIFSFFSLMHPICSSRADIQFLSSIHTPTNTLQYGYVISLMASSRQSPLVPIEELYKKAHQLYYFFQRNRRLIGELTIEENPIFCLPLEIVQLSNLKKLTITGGSISRLPNAIGNMQSLRTLKIDSNQIEELPPSIGKLHHLEVLSLRRNNLRSLPESIFGLTSLKRFYLSYNRLGSLPESIGGLHSLEKLDLRNNRLDNLPEGILKLPQKTVIRLDDNPILNVFLQIRANRSTFLCAL